MTPSTIEPTSSSFHGGENTGVGCLPSPQDLPDPGIKLRSPILQEDFLPSEPAGKPISYETSVLDSLLVTQLYLTLCNPIDCSPPDSSVHGILQARILEWVAISFSRGSSQPGDQTRIYCIAGEFFTTEPHGKPLRSTRC